MTEQKVVVCENAKGKWRIFTERCRGCGKCMDLCTSKCMDFADEVGGYDNPYVLPDTRKCIMCGICQGVCVDKAIVVEKNL